MSQMAPLLFLSAAGVKGIIAVCCSRLHMGKFHIHETYVGHAEVLEAFHMEGAGAVHNQIATVWIFATPPPVQGVQREHQLDEHIINIFSLAHPSAGTSLCSPAAFLALPWNKDSEAGVQPGRNE